MNEFFHYTLFGLHLRSSIRLPELTEATVAQPDVTIALGKVPASIGQNGQSRTIDGGAIIAVDQIANYEVSDGKRLVVEPKVGVDERNVRLFLLGSAMGMLLHQRGLLPLHANGIAIDGRAFLFMGASGAGKSTLASWFVSRGYKLLADDVCALAIRSGGFVAMPGIPRFRLWEDAVRRQGRSVNSFSLSYAGDENYRKFDVPIRLSDRETRALPVGGIYVLETGAPDRPFPVAGVSAVQQLYAHTYRGEYVASLGLQARHLDLCSTLANSVPMFVVPRESNIGRMDRYNQDLLDHARVLAKQTSPQGTELGDFTTSLSHAEHQYDCPREAS